MALRDLAEEQALGMRLEQAALHGVDIDAGTPLPGTSAADPTQGRGTDAWQRALMMGKQVNARRNNAPNN